MSDKELLNGSAGVDFRADELRAVAAGRVASDDIDRWSRRPEEIASLDCLNLAAMAIFLRHCLFLEGLSLDELGWRAAEETKYGNLPWWDDAIWLPVELDAPLLMEADAPCFIGGCQRLVAELDAIQAASPLRLGAAPPGYEAMRLRAGPPSPSPDPLPLDEDDCVRWIWRALRDAALIAIEADAPLWCAPE